VTPKIATPKRKATPSRVFCPQPLGVLSEDQREYVIRSPETPTPWMNYISNPLGFCGIVSQAAGGFCFYRDPRDYRITKYRYNGVPVDRPGRYFYIRDRGTGKTWSPAWQPSQVRLDDYQCRHGQGYTIIDGRLGKVATRTTFLVPLDANCEVWSLRIENRSARRLELDIFEYCEFTLWCEPESRNIQWSLHLPKAEFDGANRLIIYHRVEKHPAFDPAANADYRPEDGSFAFMGASLPVTGFDCDRDRFLGRYRSESNPVCVELGRLSGSILRGGVPCAALQHEVILQPGASATLTVVLGYAEDPAAAASIRDRFSDPREVEAARREIRKYWDRYLSSYRLKSPDATLDAMVNVWNAYQCKTTFDWSRYISFYENGEGRGMGTRDSAQDLLAVVCQLKERSRERIRELVSAVQFPEGDCHHIYYPITRTGHMRGFSDDHLWLVSMVASWVEETGDLSILDESVAYVGGLRESLYDHLRRAVDFTAGNLGEHGFPLIGVADWNDTLHLWMEYPKGESILTAEFHVHALRRLAVLARAMGRTADAAEFVERAQAMADRINADAWDGRWYLRAFSPGPMGSHRDEVARIFLNTQTWAILSGVATPERTEMILAEIDARLGSAFGCKIEHPPFSKYDNRYGLISRYNVGHKENGVFSHANAWAVAANAVAGKGDRAMEIYRQVCPLYRNGSPEVIGTEPYVFCQTLNSDDAHMPGQGANSWLTGTASWMFVAITQYVLGVRPSLEGLIVNPRIPKGWKGFKLSRVFRGTRYDIAVRRGGQPGLRVDGKAVGGNLVRPVPGPVCRVELGI
jgi:cellobiose phosphorylase